MRYFLFSAIVVILSSCNFSNQHQKSVNNSSIVQNDKTLILPLILPSSLEDRRTEFTENVNAAKKNIKTFSKKFGWKNLWIV